MQRAKLFGQRRRAADAVLLDLLQLDVDFAERLLERLDEILDGFVPAVEVHSGRLLELGERRLRQIQERLVVPPERVGRQRRECLAQFLFRVLQESELLGRCPAFGRQLGLEPRARRGELGGKLRSNDGHLAIRLRSHDEPHADGEQQAEGDERW